MYKIIGGNLREYGPASAEDVRAWIAQGRLNSRSLAKGENDTAWRPLSEFPEFEGALFAHESPPAPSSGFTPPPLNPQVWIDEMLAREPFVPVGLCLQRSWELLKANFPLLFKASLLVWLVGLFQFVPLFGLVYMALAGPFFGGLCLVFLKRIRGESATVHEVLSGFNIAFGQLVLVGVIFQVVTGLGFCCILPGVFLFVAWIFAVPLVIDKRLEFWSAMELSRKLVTRAWVPMFLLLTISLLPVIILKVTADVKLGTQAIELLVETLKAGQPDPGRLIERAMRLNLQAFSLNFFGRLMLLACLPFAAGAVMSAYETVFGARPTGNS